MTRKRLLAAAIASSILLSGCGAVSWSIKVKCPAGGSSSDCTIEGEVSEKSHGSFDPYEFDASNLVGTISSSNVSVAGSSGLVSATLRDSSGNVLGAASFPWVRHGTEIYFSDPASVNSWIRGFSGVANIDLAWGSLQAMHHQGNNTFVFEVVYDGTIQGGDSAAWYVGPGEGGPPNQEN